jgi:hypothetical protein
MLLQTLVQLNILLFVAPALAGWAGLPSCHPLFAPLVRVSALPSAESAAGRVEITVAVPPAVVAVPPAIALTQVPAISPMGLWSDFGSSFRASSSSCSQAARAP